MQPKTSPPHVSVVTEGSFVLDCAASGIELACAILGFDCREVGTGDYLGCTVFLFGVTMSSTPVTVGGSVMRELLSVTPDTSPTTKERIPNRRKAPRMSM